LTGGLRKWYATLTNVLISEKWPWAIFLGEGAMSDVTLFHWEPNANSGKPGRAGAVACSGPAPAHAWADWPEDVVLIFEGCGGNQSGT
jgi:hypothetical protein